MVTAGYPRSPSSKIMTAEAAAEWRHTVRGALVYAENCFREIPPPVLATYELLPSCLT